MSKTRTVICQKCKNPFESEIRITGKNGKRYDTTQLKGRTCPGCKKALEKSRQKKYGRSYALAGRTSTQHKLEDIAKSLGISNANARQIERRAIAKLREVPELKDLFHKWLEEGGEMPAMEQVVPVQTDISGRLVEYMLELSRWYAVENNLRCHGRHKEALQCHREIDRFHRTFKKQLETMGLV